MLDSAVDPARYGAEETMAATVRANRDALDQWAGRAADHDGTYHLGRSRAAVRRIVAASAK
ncbi:hypothetical protein [Streptomyces sp. NBC_00893]|uniref:hypothetical protein n=1 Tax=Streptomyces sp. NBC_00893 TaxID=2975862 RepID=UPI002256912B|nr:hypothetical protein [Streptomyces sp. NBC_00893]MCX4850828.1 hypothetical protein [Streptomyces sp. NBC_00893]